jgi:polyadenylate-binding protein 2
MARNANRAFEELEHEIESAENELSCKNEEIKSLEGKISEVDEVDHKSVYVGNVDFTSSTEEIREFFKECGVIERVTIPLDRYTQQPKGFAYLEFTDVSGVAKAQALNDSVFKGRKLKIIPKRTNIPGLSRRSHRSTFQRRGYQYGRSRFYRFRPY